MHALPKLVGQWPGSPHSPWQRLKCRVPECSGVAPRHGLDPQLLSWKCTNGAHARAWSARAHGAGPDQTGDDNRVPPGDTGSLACTWGADTAAWMARCGTATCSKQKAAPHALATDAAQTLRMPGRSGRFLAVLTVRCQSMAPSLAMALRPSRSHRDGSISTLAPVLRGP